MAKIKVMGNAAVIESSLTLGDIALVKAYRPKALTLKFGATFGAANADGKAIITELYAPVSDDIKSELADKYGAAMTNLGKLEEVLPTVVEEIKAERAALIASIEVQ